MFRTRPASVGAVLPDPIENNARCSAALMEDSLLKHIFLTSMFAAAIALPAFAADYTIMAPAAPGGGWDQTARSLQQVMQKEGISGNVQVMNVPGAGGTIGLAQFTGQNNGNPNALIVGGYVMVGAILTNKSPVSLKDVTPIARLTGEYEAIVVPTSSDIKTMDDLVAKLKADPGSVSWGGGSAGGTDHIAVGLIAKAVGVDPTKINYVAFSGGGEALAAILGGQVTAGISGYGEFEIAGEVGPAAPARRLRRRTHRRRRRADAEGSRRRRQPAELAHGRGRSRPLDRADRRRDRRFRQAVEVRQLAGDAEDQGLGRHLPRRRRLQGAARQGCLGD